MGFPFKLHTKKAIQAISYLLEKKISKSMNYMRLLKILYIADRESIRETNAPMTGDAPVAMKRGPLPEGIYQLIRSQHPDKPLWDKFFKTEDYHLLMTQSPGIDELSRFELAKLDELTDRYRDKDEYDMVEIVHKFPEWIKNDPGDSSKMIPLEDILAALQMSAMQDRVEEEARVENALDEAFGSV